MFRGHDTQRERLAAVKLFKLDLPPETTHQLVAGLERIVEAGLSHPAIATPIAAGLTDVSAYLAMDYVAAESLDLTVRELGAASPADALQVGARVAGALDHAFAAGFTHGCLHPRDVLMSAHDARVTGIGIGQLLAELGVAVPVRRPYTAPERLVGEPWDRRADVFSLAALVHELLWGTRISGTGSQAVEGMTSLPGGDLDALKRVFKRALAEDPGERHPTAKIFVDALKRALPDVAAELPPPVAEVRRNLRLAAANRGQKHDLELLLPLDQPRFTDVDVEPDPTALTGPSILERAPDAVTPKSDAVTPKSDAVTPKSAHPQDPLALSWLAPDMPSKDPDPVRLEDIAVEKPAAPPPPPVAEVAHQRPEPVLAFATMAPADETLLERSRSAVWPLLLALAIGAALGFAGGYAVGVREHPAAVATAATPPAPPGREFTESTVPDVPKPPAEEVRPKADATTPENKPPTPAARTPDAADAARKPDAPVTPPKSNWTAGRLNVRSTPAGAKVFVDDREVGRTPTAVRDLAEGPHRIHIARDGYAGHDRRIVITRERPVQLVTATLARQVPAAARTARPVGQPPATPAAPAGRGALTVDSRPSGARVFLDGKLLGTTPLSMPAVPAGDHAIRLEHDGYRNWAGSVRIVATEQARVTASLER